MAATLGRSKQAWPLKYNMTKVISRNVLIGVIFSSHSVAHNSHTTLWPFIWWVPNILTFPSTQICNLSLVSSPTHAKENLGSPGSKSLCNLLLCYVMPSESQIQICGISPTFHWCYNWYRFIWSPHIKQTLVCMTFLVLGVICIDMKLSHFLPYS